MALLWKMICNLGDPMSLRHPVQYASHFQTVYIHKLYTTRDRYTRGLQGGQDPQGALSFQVIFHNKSHDQWLFCGLLAYKTRDRYTRESCRVAKTHRVPYFYKSFSTTIPTISGSFAVFLHTEHGIDTQESCRVAKTPRVPYLYRLFSTKESVMHNDVAVISH